MFSKRSDETASSSSKANGLEEDDENDQSVFFDAKSDPDECENDVKMDLETALEESKLAIFHFFNNNFEAARYLLKTHADTSMYHCIGNATFLFLEAILTFEQQHIVIAGDELKKCMDVCQRYRKKNTITEAIGIKLKGANYSRMTDLEAHAELCFAEALLLKALLSFIEDETLSCLIRGSMRIRECYSRYKDCAQILTQRQWTSVSSKIHFESGVCMGLGAFNLMISLLPGGIIRILEFIGFSGNKSTGLRSLQNGYNLPGLRQVLCAITILAYHLIVCYVLSYQEGNLQLCDDILEEQLQHYPKGVWFLFFKGRLEFMRGNLDKARYWYIKSWKSQTVWKQFHHLSFWELLWVNCIKMDWREASLYASYLVKQSKWSRSIYSYQLASIMLMMEQLTNAEQQAIENLMHDVSKFKQRIAGKSLPLEKFICKKADRYFTQKRTLCLPAIELMYVWNTFKIIGKKYHLVDGIYQLIDRKLRNLEDHPVENDPYAADNHALCLLLRGACYRQMKQHNLASQDLEACITLQKSIKEDNYLMPYASVEIGLLLADKDCLQEAIITLEDVKKKFTGFSLESRLHFRIHAALTELRGRLTLK